MVSVVDVASSDVLPGDVVLKCLDEGQMMKEKELSEIERKSLFHGAFDYIKRLDELLKALDQITIIREGPANVNHWRTNLSLLNALYKELYAKMTPQEREEHDKAYKLMKSQMNRAINNPQSVGSRTRYNVDFLDMFDDFEKSLRSVAERKGLLMPDRKDMSEAIEL